MDNYGEARNLLSLTVKNKDNMIRPYINITTENGELVTCYPPLQWNEVTSKRKMLTDCKVWMHSKHPTWAKATINLKHFNYTESIEVERKR